MTIRPIIISILLILSLSIAAISQIDQTYFKFEITSPAELNKLTRIISIDNVRESVVYAYASDRQLREFETLGYRYTRLPDPGSLINPRMADTPELTMDWDSYPTYEVYIDMMLQYQNDYPNLCRIENIGNSVQGRQILFAKLSTNVDLEENEPEIMYSSSIHGDETTGYILMLRLIDYLLSGYGNDPRVAALLDNMEIWINPLANPDGAYHGGNNTINGAIRYNANGYDLNRNFPDPAEGPNPTGPWQPETIAMMNFFDQHNFVISANFHGGVEVVNYPWDTWSRRHADDSWYIDLCRQYADTAQANSPSGYMDDLNNGITNGYDWYRVVGGRQDYLNYWKGCRETTIELSRIKLVPPQNLPGYWNYNIASLLNYIEQANYGIKGIVTDNQTGLPVAATVSVVGHDIDSSEVYADPQVGDYHRMLSPGLYDLRFTALGYNPQLISGITVGQRNTVIVDTFLDPLSDLPMLEFSGTNYLNTDPGDTVEMAITLANNGGGDASGVNAALSTSDNFITILQPTSNYPMIPALGGTGLSLTNYIFAISPACPCYHETEFRLDITADGGYLDSAYFTLTFGRMMDNFESGDFSSFPWQMSGQAEWEIDFNNAHNGLYSAGSGPITHYQNSAISLDYEVTSPGPLTFFYKVSSESDYDFLSFYIDDILQAQWSGEIGWARASFDVSPGMRNFKWAYEKDQSVNRGSDRGWIDLIFFPPSIISGPVIPGDANNSGRLDGLDVVYLVAYLKGYNPEPDPYLSADANGDCAVNGLDVTYLVNYFKGWGNPPFSGDCR